MNVFIAFLHHFFAFSIVSILVAELMLLSEPLSLSSARKIQRLDLFYGIAAGAIFGLGAWRVMALEKGFDYYVHNSAFIAKILIFAVVGIVSIYPTMTFLKWRPALRGNILPDVSATQIGRLRTLICFQLSGVAIMLLLAATAAKGLQI